MNFLSKDSLCYSFDHRANGYARGEGVAVLVLKKLSDAVRDNDMIRAVIRGSSSNQDGRTPGITQPSSASQEDLIRTVYKSCKLDFKVTRYVEAHGECATRDWSRSILLTKHQAPALSLETQLRPRPLAESLGVSVPLENHYMCE